jgi:hypothetical protein
MYTYIHIYYISIEGPGVESGGAARRCTLALDVGLVLGSACCAQPCRMAFDASFRPRADVQASRCLRRTWRAAGRRICCGSDGTRASQTITAHGPAQTRLFFARPPVQSLCRRLQRCGAGKSLKSARALGRSRGRCAARRAARTESVPADAGRSHDPGNSTGPRWMVAAAPRPFVAAAVGRVQGAPLSGWWPALRPFLAALPLWSPHTCSLCIILGAAARPNSSRGSVTGIRGGGRPEEAEPAPPSGSVATVGAQAANVGRLEGATPLVFGSAGSWQGQGRSGPFEPMVGFWFLLS